MTRHIAAAALLAISLSASMADAQSTVTGARGGTLTRTVAPETVTGPRGRSATLPVVTRSYSGPNGGSAETRRACGLRSCGWSRSATGPDGTTVTRGGTIRRTPYGGAVLNRTVTGPAGRSVRIRRRW